MKLDDEDMEVNDGGFREEVTETIHLCINLSCTDDVFMAAVLLQQRSDFLLQTSEQ